MCNTLLLCLLAAMASGSSCNNIPDESHRLTSANYGDREVRVQRLRPEINAFSAIRDAEFDLFNVNGLHQSRNPLEVPGASSGRYRFLVRIDPDSARQWLDGYIPDTAHYTADTSWRDLVPAARTQQWQPISAPQGYHTADGKSRALFYRSDGILYKDVHWD